MKIVVFSFQKHTNFGYILFIAMVKRIFSEYNNIFLLHESEDINKKAHFQNFSWF